MPKPRAFPDDRVFAALLAELERKPWETITLAALAKKAGLPLSQLQQHYADMNQMAAGLAAYISRGTIKNVGKVALTQPPRDRLFEVLMARLDILQHNRAAILSWQQALRRDPSLALATAPALWHAMKEMLALAGLDQGPGQPLKVAGLSSIYAAVLVCWSKDQSADMAKTMALLDRLLRQATQLAEILLRQRN